VAARRVAMVPSGQSAPACWSPAPAPPSRRHCAAPAPRSCGAPPPIRRGLRLGPRISLPHPGPRAVEATGARNGRSAPPPAAPPSARGGLAVAPRPARRRGPRRRLATAATALWVRLLHPPRWPQTAARATGPRPGNASESLTNRCCANISYTRGMRNPRPRMFRFRFGWVGRDFLPRLPSTFFGDPDTPAAEVGGTCPPILSGSSPAIGASLDSGRPQEQPKTREGRGFGGVHLPDHPRPSGQMRQLRIPGSASSSARCRAFEHRRVIAARYSIRHILGARPCFTRCSVHRVHR